MFGQECLAVVYAPSSPRLYTIYEPVIRMKGQAKTVVTQRPFSSKEVQCGAMEPHSLRTLLPTETQGLQSVLHKIGGTGTFVYLFAQARYPFCPPFCFSFMSMPCCFEQTFIQISISLARKNAELSGTP